MARLSCHTSRKSQSAWQIRPQFRTGAKEPRQPQGGVLSFHPRGDAFSSRGTKNFSFCRLVKFSRWHCDFPVVLSAGGHKCMLA
jgi:hypothetical protein